MTASSSGRYARIELRRRRWSSVHDLIVDRAAGFAGERQLARRHFIQDDAERKKIGARVERLAEHLLGRHVGDGAERRAGAGEVFLDGERVGVVERRSAFPATESFSSILARPKSRIFAWPRAVTKILAGLMSRWTMPAVCAASSASAISIASDKKLVHLERALGDGVLERHAIEKFHGDEADAAFAFADFVDGADVVVIERGGGAGFAAEAFERGGIFGDVVGKKFQRDETAEREVFGFVDDSHAAAAEFFDDAVVGDCLAEHWWTDVSWRQRAGVNQRETRSEVMKQRSKESNDAERSNAETQRTQRFA